MRCARCGELLPDGEVVLVDADGEAYCDTVCYAEATASEAIVDGCELVLYASGRHCDRTYAEANRLADIYERLTERLRLMSGAWDAIANDDFAKGRAMEAIVWRSCAAALRDAIEDAAYPETARPATGESNAAGRTHEMDPMPIVPQEGSA